MSAANLKQRIHNGEHVYGANASLSTSREDLIARVENGGYDFVAVDSQHSPYNEDRLVAFCNMANELGIPVNFRIKHTRNAYLIGNYLDLGPTGIEVPQVELDETVNEAVAAFYYPQQGIRSWGGAARVNSAGRERLEYAEWWNNNGMLMLQIETLRAIENIHTLALPGVDMFSWGPSDLEFDREMHPHHPFQTDDDCILHVMKQLETQAARMCYRSYEPDLRNKYLDMGVTVLMERAK